MTGRRRGSAPGTTVGQFIVRAARTDARPFVKLVRALQRHGRELVAKITFAGPEPDLVLRAVEGEGNRGLRAGHLKVVISRTHRCRSSVCVECDRLVLRAMTPEELQERDRRGAPAGIGDEAE